MTGLKYVLPPILPVNDHHIFEDFLGVQTIIQIDDNVCCYRFPFVFYF